MFAIRTILHPTDFSEHSQQAFQVASALAHATDSRLLVLHVVPPLAHYQTRGQRDEAELSLRRLESPHPNVKLERQVLAGDPAGEILGVARESGCDLIVMGTRGLTGMSWLLMGSVAEMVSQNAPCPVITVRLPPPGSESSLRPAGAETGKIQETAVWEALKMPHS